MNDHRKPKVGLLALTLELYETLAPALRQSRENWLRRDVLPALGASADVLFSAAVYRRTDIEAAVAAYEAQGVDCLLVMLLTYSPSQLALPALKRTHLPIIVWNTQELYAVDEKFGSPEMIDNHGVHGTQDLCNVLIRCGIPFHYVTSHLRDRHATRQLEDFFVASAAASRLRKARLGLMGYPFPGMGDFAIDTTHLVGTLGCQPVMLSVEEYITRAAAAKPADAAAIVADYRKLYEVAPDITPEDLDTTARVEIALRGMVADYKLDGFTYQFTAFGEDERTPTVPFVPTSRLMAEGCGFGGEGDLIAVAGSCLLNWLQPPASFTEIFTIDFAGNGLFMSHMGEMNVAMARKDRKVKLVARPGPITRTRGRQLCLVASMEPGEATLCALTLGTAGQWRLVASPMAVADYGPLAMEVPNFKLLPQGDVRDFLTGYAKASGPHHNAACFGDARPRLKIVAELLKAAYCAV